MKTYIVTTSIDGFERIEVTKENFELKFTALRTIVRMGLKKKPVSEVKRGEIYAALVLVENKCVNTNLGFFQ